MQKEPLIVAPLIKDALNEDFVPALEKHLKEKALEVFEEWTKGMAFSNPNHNVTHRLGVLRLSLQDLVVSRFLLQEAAEKEIEIPRIGERVQKAVEEVNEAIAALPEIQVKNPLKAVDRALGIELKHGRRESAQGQAIKG